MKKTFIILLAIVILLIGALLVIPIFFKKNLIEVAQNTLNKQLKAEVEFANLKVSLFQNFPQATVEFHDLMIKGIGDFENDTLLNVDYIRTQMDLSSLFSKSNMSIEEIVLSKPKIQLIVAKNGKANWDVAKTNGSQNSSKVEQDKEADEFQLALKKIEIRDAELVYQDKQGKMLASLKDIDFDISGEMFGSSTQLQTKGTVADFTYGMDGVNYISKTSLDITTLLHADFEQIKFTIAENELLVNRLPLELSGSVAMPSDTTFVDLKLQTKQSDFQNFLALVPPVYEEYLKDIQTSGSATISGMFTGFFVGENYPEINLTMAVADGNFRYADMPEEIKKIRAGIELTKPQGDLDLLEIKVDEAHAEIRNNPVDLNLLITNPVSDPYFDGALIGKVNLSHLKNALPIDSVDISGLIDVNFFAKGNYSDVEAEAYEKIQSDGVVILDNFEYISPTLTQVISVPQGKLNFSPRNIELKGMSVEVGQSDFYLSGKVSNYINYIFKKGVLKGNLQLRSNYTNLNELFRLQLSEQASPKEQTGESSEEESLVFDIPEGIDITFRSNIKQAVFQRIPIQSVEGVIRATNQKLVLDGLNMNMLDGSMTMNGSYQNTLGNQPFFDFGFEIANFDIPAMYNTVSGARKLLPGANGSKGKLSTSLNMKGRLSPQMKLIPSSANGEGVFSTKNVEIKDSPLFNQLSGILKKEKLRNVDIDDFTANLTVENGNLLLQPFTTKVIGQETKVQGSLNAESLLDMRLDFNVEREMFGPDIQKFLNVIPGNQKIKMLPAGVLIKGPVGEPKVNLDLSETQKAVADATKDDLKKSLDQLGKGLKKLFK